MGEAERVEVKNISIFDSLLAYYNVFVVLLGMFV